MAQSNVVPASIQKVMGSVFSVEKVGDSDVVVFKPQFKEACIKAANGLEKLLAVDLKPLSVELYQTYKYLVLGEIGGPLKATMSQLQFFHAIDSSVPTEWGKVGTAARQKAQAHPTVNRLRYLIEKVGRPIVDPVTDADRKAAKDKAEETKKSQAAKFAAVCKRRKISPEVAADILKVWFVTSDGKLTAKGKSFLKKISAKFAEQFE